MCLLAFAWNPDAPSQLLAMSNRDEFYARPSQAAHWWSDYPEVWAGRDLRGGGSWCGVTRYGRFAALTNFRDGHPANPQAPSRGDLVKHFLIGDASPEDYLQGLRDTAAPFNSFSLVVADLLAETPSCGYWSFQRGRHSAAPRLLEPGVYGLSNAGLDTPWPKLVHATAGLATLKATEASLSAYFSLFGQQFTADDAVLPQTGLPLDRERALSSPFIIMDDYGTRAQTYLSLSAQQESVVAEKIFDSANEARQADQQPLQIDHFQLEKTVRKN